MAESGLEARTEPDNEARVAGLLRVLDVCLALATATDLKALLEMIKEAARAVLNCEGASVFLHDQKTGELVSRVATGVEEIRFPADRGIAGETLRTGQVIKIPDVYAD